MKTYFIDGNSMHLAGSQIDISDNFFGSESPESDATDPQRQDAIRFWLSEGWMDAGDVVVWDGVQYIVGGESPSLDTYTVDEVARLFHVTAKTIYNWANAGKLPVIRTSKSSGSKMLFPKKSVHAKLRPVMAD